MEEEEYPSQSASCSVFYATDFECDGDNEAFIYTLTERGFVRGWQQAPWSDIKRYGLFDRIVICHAKRCRKPATVLSHYFQDCITDDYEDLPLPVNGKIAGGVDNAACDEHADLRR